MSVHVFVGPTLSARDILSVAPGATIHPPVAHGDLLRLGLDAGDVAVIIDGYYHQRAPIRHKEILALLAAGTKVVGCASMGALRAAELHPFGMIGHGVVYDMYRAGTVDADDEVAVAHAAPPEYTKVTEPLVNIRYALTAVLDARALTERQAAGLLALARDLHYTERSWRAIEHAAATKDGAVEALATLRAFLAEHAECGDIKARDAADTLRRLEEIAAAGSGDRAQWTASTQWRNRYLYDWEACFAGAKAGDTHVEYAAVAKYQQIYHPDFPRRWRSFALTRIAESAGDAGNGTGNDLQARALAAAEVKGVAMTTLERTQLRHWLTAEENSRLPTTELLTHVLIRSYRPPRLAADLVIAAAELVDDPHAKSAVAESYAINATVAAERAGQSIDRLKTAMLRAHLVDVWQLAADDDEPLLAAARDRGFESISAAMDALRPYFIRCHHQAVEQAAAAKSR